MGIFEHRSLSGPIFDLLMVFLNWTSSTLVVPAIVLEEAIKKFREHVTQKARQVETSIKKLDGLLVRPSGAQLPPIDIQKVCDEYRVALRERLESLKATVPEYDDIPITDIVARALEPRRPFRGDDRGFRDCVIWETFLRTVVAEDRLTVLITKNANDFAADGSLHPDLTEDLTVAGFSPDAVLLVATIEDFVKQSVVPFKEKIAQDPEWASHEITAGNWPEFDLDAFLEGNGSGLLSALDSEASSLAAEAGFWDRDIAKLEEPFSVVDVDFDPLYTELLEAVPLEDGKVFIEVGAGGTAHLDGMLFKTDYYCLPEDSGIEVMDGDWNKSYMWVQTAVEVRLTIHITVDLKTNTATQWELNAVEVPEPRWDDELEEDSDA